jgi:hypothetical protein
MATGDEQDQLYRQLTLTPQGWFEESGGTEVQGGTAGTANSPHVVLDAILSGLGSLWAWAYSLMMYASAQMRVQTSTDGWLELAALDYFGQGQFPRQLGELDPAYAARIQANILPQPCTRAAISAAIEALTSAAPLIVEPWQPADTGCSFSKPIANGVAGGAAYSSNTSVHVPGRYGGRSHRLAYQAFIDTVLPPAVDTAALSYCLNTHTAVAQTGFCDALSFYDDGVAVPPNEQEVLGVITKLKAEGTLIWVRFNAP